MIRNFFHQSSRNQLLLLFVLALIIRIIVAIYFFESEVWLNFGDDTGRLCYAQTILNEGFLFKLNDFHSSESIFAPGVPAFLAFTIFFFGKSWLAVFLLNALISSISCYIIYRIALVFFQREVALLSFFWAALYPNYIRYIGSAGNEPWLVLLLALAFFFLIQSFESANYRKYLSVAAISFTLLYHFDERYIFYTLFFILAIFLDNKPLYMLMKRQLFFAVLLLILFLPWQIRNYLVYDDIVVISCRTNNLTEPIFHQRKELLFFNHDPDLGHFSIQQLDSVNKGLLSYYPNTPNKRPISNVHLQAMKSGNLPHQFNLLEKIISRFSYLWMPVKLNNSYRISGYDFVQKWSLGHNLMTGLSYGLLLPFMFLGLYFLFKSKRNRVGWLFILLMFYHTFLHVAFIPYTRDRYRHPIDFAIIILGCYGITIFYSKIKQQISSPPDRTI